MRPIRYVGIHSIIPPYMLEEIAKRGKPHQRDWALRSLTSAGFIRGQRHALGIIRSAASVGGKSLLSMTVSTKTGSLLRALWFAKRAISPERMLWSMKPMTEQAPPMTSTMISMNATP